MKENFNTLGALKDYRVPLANCYSYCEKRDPRTVLGASTDWECERMCYDTLTALRKGDSKIYIIGPSRENFTTIKPISSVSIPIISSSQTYSYPYHNQPSSFILPLESTFKNLTPISKSQILSHPMFKDQSFSKDCNTLCLSQIQNMDLSSSSNIFDKCVSKCECIGQIHTYCSNECSLSNNRENCEKLCFQTKSPNCSSTPFNIKKGNKNVSWNWK